MDKWVIVTEDDLERAWASVLEFKLDRLYYRGFDNPSIDSLDAQIEYEILRQEIFQGDVNASIRRKD